MATTATSTGTRTTIDFTVEKSGALADVTSVKLSAPSGAYGVRRKDNMAVVVADGTALDRIGLGTYQYSFDDPAADLTYQYYIEVDDGGVVSYLDRETSLPIDSTSLLFGRYATSACIEEKFGRDNVTKWTQLDSDPNPSQEAARTRSAILWAENFVDDSLRGGYHCVPFETPVPEMIKDIACTLSAIKLYEGRGVQDFDPDSGKPQDRFTSARKQSLRTLNMIRSGRLRLNSETTKRYPQVESDTESKSATVSEPPRA